MKKLLIILAAATLALVGCTKAVSVHDQTVSFAVVADNTKAAIPATVDACKAVVRMYDSSNNLLGDIYAMPTCTKVGDTYTFSVDVMGGQKYQITVLMYTDGIYTIDDKLEVISRNDVTKRNDPALDLYSASITYTVDQGATTIVATRPFALLNLITTDLVAGHEPAITLKYTAPKYFNAVTGEVSGSQEYQTAGELIERKYDGESCHLTSDYIFASDVKSYISVEMTADVLVRTFDNLPIVRNRVTNLSGQLLSENSALSVSPTFNWKDQVTEKPASFIVDSEAKTVKLGDQRALAWLSKTLGNQVNRYANYTISLESDLDMGEGYFTPINVEGPFVFDGKNHTISNLVISGGSDCGLFGCIYGSGNTVKNLKMASARLDDVTYAGCVAAKAYADFQNIAVMGCNIESDYWCVGGIVGVHYAGNISNCSVANSMLKGGCPGGLVGYCTGTDTRLYENCSAENVNLVDLGVGDYSSGAIVSVVGVNGLVLKNCSKVNMTENLYGYKDYTVTIE